MEEFAAGRPFGTPPQWAELERFIIDRLDEAARPVYEQYVDEDGSVMWPPNDDYTGFNGLDDAYESVHNWPLHYVLGGDEWLLEAAQATWEGITEQFTRYDSGHGHPMVVDEYEQGRDWFHQSEGNLLFYNLCLADPGNEAMIERAERFADLYVDPTVGNYDPDERLITAPESGSMGPGENFAETWGYAGYMEYYGLPFQDVEGVDCLDDLREEENARRMGTAMRERASKGDTVVNLAITSLVYNAYLLTGDDRYRDWVLEYVDAWQERAVANDGIVPDNVGRSGEVGQYLDGTWYGGFYGWTWPHGWLSIGDALIAATQNAVLASGDEDYLDLPRGTLDALLDAGIERAGTLYVPYRHGDEGWYGYSPFVTDVLRDGDGDVLWRDGWFEFQPMRSACPVHLWHTSMAPADRDRLEAVRNPQTRDWERLLPYDRKDQGGHEDAWVAYLEGEYPDYPTEILEHNLQQVYRRLDFVRRDEQDPTTYDDDYLQKRNPVTLEGLVQLTTGGPLPLYNGGLFMSRLRHFDPIAKRPGLPPDVAALVTNLDADATDLTLANVGVEERPLVVQGGAYGEHRFTSVSYDMASDGRSATRVAEVEDDTFEVTLRPGSTSKLRLATERYVNDPSYAFPWDRS